MTYVRIRQLTAALPVLVLLVVGIGAVGGCGSGATGSGVDGEVDSVDSINRPPELIVTNPENTFNVTINNGQFLVDKLEIEFNRRKGIHEFYGFYRDSYDQMARIPFARLERVDFLGEMPVSLFEQALIGREQENLRHKDAFTLRLTFRDQSQKEFFAIIPKFRGIKDFQLWEFSNIGAITLIEFDR